MRTWPWTRRFTIDLFLSIPITPVIAIGAPLLFQTLGRSALDPKMIGGHPEIAPAPAEAFWLLCFLITALPFLISVMGVLTLQYNVESMIERLDPSFSIYSTPIPGMMTSIGFIVGAVVQLVAWGAVVYFIVVVCHNAYAGPRENDSMD